MSNEPESVEGYLKRIQSDSTAALKLIPTTPVPPVGIIVKPGEDLQAALNVGGVINLEDGGTYEGSYRVYVTGTRLVGAKSKIVGPSHSPAIRVPPGSADIQITLGEAQSAWDDSVIQIGEADESQTSVNDVPRDIVLTGITVPTHRGKRAFAINGKSVLLDGCSALDTYDPAGRDSQGILIWNTPGNVYVRGGKFQAGSENLLVGGGTTAIVGVIPTNLVFEDVEFSRPLSWRTDGVKRKVKTLFELKAGIGVILRRAILSGCWVDAQVGYAIMITPRDGKGIHDVLFEDVIIKDVGNVSMMQVQDDEKYSPRTENIRLSKVDGQTNLDFGSGRFFQWLGKAKNVSITQSKFLGHGTTLHCDPGPVWIDETHRGPDSGISELIKFEDNQPSLASYGMMLNGNAYASKWKESLLNSSIERNAFNHVPANTVTTYQKNLPASNTYET